MHGINLAGINRGRGVQNKISSMEDLYIDVDIFWNYVYTIIYVLIPCWKDYVTRQQYLSASINFVNVTIL